MTETETPRTTTHLTLDNVLPFLARAVEEKEAYDFAVQVHDLLVEDSAK